MTARRRAVVHVITTLPPRPAPAPLPDDLLATGWARVLITGRHRRGPR